MHCPILCLYSSLELGIFSCFCLMCPACCPFLIFISTLVLLLLLLLATSTLVKHSISKNQIQLNYIINATISSSVLVFLLRLRFLNVNPHFKYVTASHFIFLEIFTARNTYIEVK